MLGIGNGIAIPFTTKAAGGGGKSYLLDDLTSPPDVLVSPSKIFSAVYETTAIIRLRRTSDGAESDFTGEEVTAGDDLTWVGSQTSFTRYVYDQSGNGKHQGQATAGYQGQYTDASGSKITMSDGNPAPQQIPIGMTFPALGFTGADGAAVFRFNGNSDTSWKLMRNGGAHLVDSVTGNATSPVSGVGTPVIKVNGTTLSPYTKGEFYAETTGTDVTVRITDIDWSANANWNIIVPYLTYFGNAKFSSVALYNAEPSSADLDTIVTYFEAT